MQEGRTGAAAIDLTGRREQLEGWAPDEQVELRLGDV